MLHRLITYLRGLRRRRKVEAETDDELRFHVEMETEANRARGLSIEEARRTALADLGGVTQTREAVRAVRATWIDAAWQDLRHAVRTLRRSPGFLSLAVLVLALGIGLNAAVFSIVTAVFFRPVPVSNPEELVYVYRFQMLDPRHTAVTSLHDIEFFEPNTDVFSGFSAHWGRSAALAVDGEIGDTWGEITLGNYFDLLRLSPLLGRTLTRADDEVANPQLSLVISYDLWMRRLKGDPDTIGKLVRLNDKFFTVVGVMERGFTGLSEPWMPTQWWVTTAAFFGKDRYAMGAMARLKPGVTLSQAQAAITVQSTRMQQARFNETPAQFRQSGFRPNPYIVRRASDVLTPFEPDAGIVPQRLAWAASAVGAIVLLIAVFNVVGILMVRGITRARELAVRQALGAGGARLARELITESVLVAATGGCAGLLVAWFGVHLYQAYTPSPFGVAVALDQRLLLFTGLICLGVSLVMGLAPVLQARKLDVRAMMGSGAAGPTPRSRRRLRYGIVVPQVACATALLVVTGVHGRTLLHIETTDRGYHVEDVTVLRVSPWDPAAPTAGDRFQAIIAGTRAARSRAFFGKVYGDIRSMPGLNGAVTDRLPVFSDLVRERFTSHEAYLSDPETTTTLSISHVSPGYFRTMGTRVLQGRDFDDRDGIGSPRSAIVSAALAADWWPGQNPVGKAISAYAPGEPTQKIEWHEVIGVVNDVRAVGADEAPRPWVYLPLDQWKYPWGYVIAHANDGSASAISALRNKVLAADPYAQVTRTQTLEQIAGEILYPRRTAAGILVGAALLGLVLACVGLYGLVSYSVAQRLPEIGIRSALGADRRDILSLVLRDGAAAAAIGAVPGFAVSLMALRVTSNLVGPVPTSDAATFVLVPVVVAIVVLIACFVPARRAVRVDPTILLRGL